MRLADDTGLEVVVDLEHATFMDCAGARTLLEAGAAIGRERFSVTPGSPQVQRLFELTGIASQLRVTPGPLTLGRRAA